MLSGYNARRWLMRVGLLLWILPFPRLGEGADSAPWSPDLPYTADKTDPIVHDVEFVIVVTPPYHCQVLKVWVPVPPSDAAQQITGSEFDTFPLEVKPRIETEPVYKNRFAYFEFHRPQGAQIIRHRFRATVWNLNWKVTPENVSPILDWPDSFACYLKPQALENEQAFQELLHRIVPKRVGPSTDLSKVMDWIDRNLTYDHIQASLKADANHAFSLRRGHCSDYHGLCATMGRMLGYPTRVTYGISLYPKNSPSHCKMEAYLPPHGWVSFDLSETQKLIRAIEQDDQLSRIQKEQLATAARRRLRSGFRENSWLLLTRGTDYELAPRAQGPVRVVRTAYIEADGEVLPDPDPANREKREFSWMTAHRFKSDRPLVLPFKDYSTLKTFTRTPDE